MMRVAVMCPRGRLGRAVARDLLDAGVHVRLLTRSAKRFDALIQRGAEAREGSLDDVRFVVRATRGMDAICWLTPLCWCSDNLRFAQIRAAEAGAEAIRVNGIRRVVNVSCMGAHLEERTGIIAGLHDVEEILDKAAPAMTHLRPAYFFENYLWQLDNILHEGSVFLPVSGMVRCPMIATCDVAQIAADRLLDPTWTGRLVRELHGPADLSFDQAATLISRATGHRVIHVAVDPRRAADAMRSVGMTKDAARMTVEFYQAIDWGTICPTEPRSAETATPTTLVEFARAVIAPRLHEPVPH